LSIEIYGTSFDAVHAAAAAEFWGAVLGRAVNQGATEQNASLAIRPNTPDTAIAFHAVPEGKSAKNRVHLDLATRAFDDELERLIGLGATIMATFEAWTTLRDPEGNEFDLIRLGD
jgi:predicted enzyme related to lactoylglutathione lyase